jgi:hypothetical protein
MHISEAEVASKIGLAHGAARADTRERKAKRRQFIQELQVALPIYLVTATQGGSCRRNRRRESGPRSAVATV